MSWNGKRLIEHIDEALGLFEQFGAACLNDPETAALLEELRRRIQETDSAMLNYGVVSACSMCAATGKGSCCFKEMGESYGFRDLFINLLLGSTLPVESEFPGSCHFVGPNGCRLQGAPSLLPQLFLPGPRKFSGSGNYPAYPASGGKTIAR